MLRMRHYLKKPLQSSLVYIVSTFARIQKYGARTNWLLKWKWQSYQIIGFKILCYWKDKWKGKICYVPWKDQRLHTFSKAKRWLSLFTFDNLSAQDKSGLRVGVGATATHILLTNLFSFFILLYTYARSFWLAAILHPGDRIKFSMVFGLLANKHMISELNNPKIRN